MAFGTLKGYIIRDHNESRPVSKLYGPTQGSRARTRAEKLNLEYGAHRYSAIAVWYSDNGVAI